METYQYIIIGASMLLIGVGLFLIRRSKSSKPTKSYDLDFIVSLLDKNNIVNIDYIRNKIVIEFNDVTLFDTKKLHEKGALGVSVVGDKVKFYFDGGNEKNEQIYNELRNFMER